PTGELQGIVAQQGVAQELHFGRRVAGDEQHANPLAGHADRNRVGVVVRAQLRADVGDRGAVIDVAERLGRDAEIAPLERRVFAEQLLLAADFAPRAVFLLLFERDAGRGVFQAARFDQHGDVYGIANEDHRAGFDVGQPGVARAFERAYGQRDDRHAVLAGLRGDVARIGAGIRAAVGDQQDAGQRLPAVRGQGAGQGVADAGLRAAGAQAVETLFGGQRLELTIETIERDFSPRLEFAERFAHDPLGMFQAAALAEQAQVRLIVRFAQAQSLGRFAGRRIVGVGIAERHAL